MSARAVNQSAGSRVTVSGKPCGRASERALASGQRSVESLAASDLNRWLGPAFDDLREGGY